MQFKFKLNELIPGSIDRERLISFFRNTEGVKLKNDSMAFVRMRIQENLLDDMLKILVKINVANLREKAVELISSPIVGRSPGKCPKLVHQPLPSN